MVICMLVKYSKNKTREFIYLDDKEKRYNDIMNEYGYNFYHITAVKVILV